ncbi:MAG: hypothetical protein ABIS59_02360 [Candidatus Saccharibacteria bacterium]
MTIVAKKSCILSAREILRQDNRQEVILLAIEDITTKKILDQINIFSNIKRGRPSDAAQRLIICG